MHDTLRHGEPTKIEVQPITKVNQVLHNTRRNHTLMHRQSEETDSHTRLAYSVETAEVMIYVQDRFLRLSHMITKPVSMAQASTALHRELHAAMSCSKAESSRGTARTRGQAALT